MPERPATLAEQRTVNSLARWDQPLLYPDTHIGEHDYSPSCPACHANGRPAVEAFYRTPLPQVREYALKLLREGRIGELSRMLGHQGEVTR